LSPEARRIILPGMFAFTKGWPKITGLSEICAYQSYESGRFFSGSIG
jgi:hypothetical protein